MKPMALVACKRRLRGVSPGGSSLGEERFNNQLIAIQASEINDGPCVKAVDVQIASFAGQHLMVLRDSGSAHA